MRLFPLQYKVVKAVNTSIPVKSAIFILLQSITPLKAVASLTCISVSSLVLISSFPTKYVLKLTSGMFTFWPNPIIGKAINISSSFFIFKFLFYLL